MVDTLCPSELFRLKPLGPYSIIHPIATLSTHCMVAVVVVILLIVIFVAFLQLVLVVTSISSIKKFDVVFWVINAMYLPSPL